MALNNSNEKLLQELYLQTLEQIKDLGAEVKKNHLEVVNKIHDLEMLTQAQQERMGFIKWMFNGSGMLGLILAIIALCKEFLHFNILS